jgi:GH43 family beta-xylosidase
MHKIDDHWYVYFSASVCAPDQWDVMLPTLRVYVLQGGKENPLSSDYKILDAIVPPNYNAGMLDATIFDIEGIDYFLVCLSIRIILTRILNRLVLCR